MKVVFILGAFGFVIGTVGAILAEVALDWNTVVASVERVVLAVVGAWGGYMLKGISETSRKGHDLANSFMLEQKRKHVVSTALNAELTKDPGYIAIAKEAKDAYDAHRETDERMRAKEAKADTAGDA